jgi:aldehyde:ferredoxin oxidoreductase
VKNVVKSEGTANIGGETIFQEICKESIDRSMYETKQTEVHYATVDWKNCDGQFVLDNVTVCTFQQHPVEIKTNISNHKVLFH